MKIGIAALGRISEDTGGKNYIVHFLRELSSLDVPHTFVVFLSNGEKEKLGLPENLKIEYRVIRGSRRTSLHKVFGEQLGLPPAIRKSGVDVMYYPGNFASFFTPTRYVVNVRGMAHYYGEEYGVGLFRRLMRQIIMPFSVRRASAVITPSEDIKRDVLKFIKSSLDLVEVIPHGVDANLFSPANKNDPAGIALLTKYNLQPNGYLLYVSALWKYKNQENLIRAFAALSKESPGLKLVLAGRGTGVDQTYINSLHELAKALGITDKIVFTGQLSQAELKYLYAHAKVFVFPSRYESFGNPIFEAWASEVPVATSNVHSFPEIVGTAGVLFDPLSPKEIADTVRRILQDEAFARELIERGRERIKFFTWEKCVSRTLSVLERVHEMS